MIHTTTKIDTRFWEAEISGNLLVNTLAPMIGLWLTPPVELFLGLTVLAIQPANVS